MDFEEALRKGCFSLHLKSDTKAGIIEEMIDLMVAAGRITDKKAALDAVLEREKKMSTGMQYGVAIPHGKSPTAGDLVTAFALKKEGIDFASIDGEPSRIFIMTVSPVNRTGPHMAYLAEISKLLSRPLIRRRLLDAQNADEVVKILTA